MSSSSPHQNSFSTTPKSCSSSNNNNTPSLRKHNNTTTTTSSSSSSSNHHHAIMSGTTSTIPHPAFGSVSSSSSKITTSSTTTPSPSSSSLSLLQQSSSSPSSIMMTTSPINTTTNRQQQHHHHHHPPHSTHSQNQLIRISFFMSLLYVVTLFINSRNVQYNQIVYFYHHMDNTNHNNQNYYNFLLTKNNNNKTTITVDPTITTHSTEEYQQQQQQQQRIQQPKQEQLQRIQQQQQQQENIDDNDTTNTNTDNNNKKKKKGPLFVYGNQRISKERDTNSSNNDSVFIPTNSNYSYAFLIGGIDIHKPAYRGFLYNVLIASKLLKELYNSTADIWLLVQLKNNNINTTTSDKGVVENDNDTDDDDDIRHYNLLSNDDLALLHNSYITHVWYLPPSKHPSSFSETVYEKFRIIDLIEYNRVLFLDADILPTSSLDYLFALTDPLSNNKSNKNMNDDNKNDNKNNEIVQFQSNLIVATLGEACNAGLFILEPKVNGYHNIIQQIIHRQHMDAVYRKIPYPSFDKNAGWGHSFRSNNDSWRAVVTTGTLWNYFASHSDQGLLYYYTKYYQQDVTIIIGDVIENWIYNTDDNNDGAPFFVQDNITSVHQYGIGHSMPIRKSIYHSILHNITNNDTVSNYKECDASGVYNQGISLFQDNVNQTRPKGYNFFCYKPYCHYKHFYGRRKPWQQSSTKIYSYLHSTISGSSNSFYTIWFQTLRDIILKDLLTITAATTATTTSSTTTTATNEADSTTTSTTTTNDNNDKNVIFMNWWISSQAEHVKESPLGYMATYSDHANRVQQKNIQNNININNNNIKGQQQ